MDLNNRRCPLNARQQKLVASAMPPAFAFAFWAIIILLVMLAVATATKKGNPFTDFFTAFGAVGQVAFAYMVWRLGREQFAYIKQSTERQMRIDTYGIKKSISDQFLGLYDAAEAQASFGEDFQPPFIEDWYSLVGDAESVFSWQVTEPMLRLAAKLDDLQPNSAFLAKVKLDHPEDIAAQQSAMKANWEEISTLRFAAWRALYLELTLNDHAVS
ncbi:hypothetical protein [Sphingobium chungangianum]